VTARPHLLTGDAVPRWRVFEQLHPEVTIIPPGTPNDRWRAIVPLGKIPGRTAETTIGDWMLAGLMDQLDEIYPADRTDGASDESAAAIPPLQPPAPSPCRARAGNGRRPLGGQEPAPHAPPAPGTAAAASVRNSSQERR